MCKCSLLVFAPPILSFWLLPKKKECAAPGVRKKKAADAINFFTEPGPFFPRLSYIVLYYLARAIPSRAAVRDRVFVLVTRYEKCTIVAGVNVRE